MKKCTTEAGGIIPDNCNKLQQPTPPEGAKKRHLTTKQLYQMLLFRIDQQTIAEGGTKSTLHKGCPLSYVAILNLRNYLAGKPIAQNLLLSGKKRAEVCKYYGIFIQAVKYSVLC